ncbi:hypothetical protein GCM10027176_11610 [Actinoallomurus bryophytorum]|uniref:LysR family transcriptional regulator substrate-binding protein n=1 Tax=Actinoallomurus bryophytorum TaxID=1490222 RepID=UPI0011527A85|nr:LysR family transcriptional regulator substrate-binding protein [Actinoallomurus bryophytorum]
MNTALGAWPQVLAEEGDQVAHRLPARPRQSRFLVAEEGDVTVSGTLKHVPADHPLAGASRCTMAQLWNEAWVLCPDSTLGRLTMSLCVTAGFEPRMAASVNDIGTAIGLAGIGWGITIAPELTPAGSEAKLARIPVDGLDTVRHNVVIVRDGEHLSPRMAAVIDAVRAISVEPHATDAG